VRGRNYFIGTFLAKSGFFDIVSGLALDKSFAKRTALNARTVSQFTSLVIHIMTKETAKTAGTVYEVGFHVVPTVSPENLPKEVDAIKAVLEKNGGAIISEEFPKLRNLAYTMVKPVGSARHRFDTAYFGWIKFEAPSETVTELDKLFKASDKIIRHLIIKTIRENTIYGPKVLADEKKEARAEEVKEEKKDVKEGEPVNQEELDKSIDKLVG
jgi:small subunit ribosomal protein S6